MKIAFDATTAAFEKRTGTGVYCKELIESYQKEFRQDEVSHTYRLARYFRGKDYLLGLTRNSKREVIVDPITFFKGFKFDIFHGLNTRLPVLSHCLKVATVHDLFSIYGSFSNEKFIKDQKLKLNQMINRADHIIVPASYTKAQLVEKMNMMPEKISVVGEGVREMFLADVKKEESKKNVLKKFNLSNPYLIFVGTLEKRKNVLGLIEIFNQLPTIHDLVLVGGHGFEYEKIKEKINNSPKNHRIKQLGFVSELELADLYRAADALAYFSFEEGYGIPIIEAMACGIPVVSSNTTSMPEVGRGYTWLVEPNNYSQATQVLLDVSKKSLYVSRQVENAKNYARQLTWGKVARDTRSVYEKVIYMNRSKEQRQ